MEGTVANILLVEDNPADVDLTRLALRDARLVNRVYVAGDGVEALAFLRKENPHQSAPRPDLILLDLNMPRLSGRELLALIKSDPSLRRIPVVILSTSDAEADIVSSYDLHANCFLTKPADLEEFDQVARSIDEFWLGLAKLPPR
jgi:chemotaxis family two-component system response regulator Rcp1